MIPSVLPTYNRAPLSFVKGDGSWLWAEDGRRYLDLGSGIAVNALGHAHPALVATLTEQAQKLWHVSNVYTIPEQERLAALLVERTFAGWPRGWPPTESIATSPTPGWTRCLRWLRLIPKA